MTLTHGGARPRSSNDPVIDWLLDTDPSIRWQVMRDLTDTPAEIVAAERSRVASQGWGPRLLDQQRSDGHWGDGVTTPPWWSNLYTLLFLRDLGLDPMSARDRRVVHMAIKDMTGVPDAIFVVDVGYHKGVINEAAKLGIPVIGVVDTNHSPEGVAYVIPGNDDSARAIALYVRGVADAVLEGRVHALNEVVDAVKNGDDEFVEVSEQA